MESDGMAHEAPHSINVNLDLPSAADIRQIIEQKEMARAKEAMRRLEAEEEEKKHRMEMFQTRKLTPEFVNTVMTRVRQAAENGNSKIMLGQFPSEWCSDGGRRINVLEADWPDTLPGFAREFYEFWERELKPRGFRLSAEIVSFKPNGIPGDVGAYLSWTA